MDDYKLTLGVDTTDKYEKAKQDLIQAMKSMSELSDNERQMLAEDLFGAARVAVAVEMFSKYFGKFSS